jgi:hypothetical protein
MARFLDVQAHGVLMGLMTGRIQVMNHQRDTEEHKECEKERFAEAPNAGQSSNTDDRA